MREAGEACAGRYVCGCSTDSPRQTGRSAGVYSQPSGHRSLRYGRVRCPQARPAPENSGPGPSAAASEIMQRSARPLESTLNSRSAMEPLQHALQLLKRQSELGNAMRRPGEIRVTEERELYQLREALSRFPATVTPIRVQALNDDLHATFKHWSPYLRHRWERKLAAQHTPNLRLLFYGTPRMAPTLWAALLYVRTSCSKQMRCSISNASHLLLPRLRIDGSRR
jgi:hypothetical protein